MLNFIFGFCVYREEHLIHNINSTSNLQTHSVIWFKTGTGIICPVCSAPLTSGAELEVVIATTIVNKWEEMLTCYKSMCADIIVMGV